MNAAPDLPLTVYGELRLARSIADRLRARMRATGPWRAVLDGTTYACERGAWALWIPTLGLKFLNSVDGRLHCLHHTAPPRRAVLGPEPELRASGPYSLQDWRKAYGTPVVRRAAEIAVATVRLHRAGLGPKLLGLCLARRLIDGGRADAGFAAGIATEDALRLPPKRPAAEPEIMAAGLRPDRIQSAIRQQVNGYVVDLNSVVGVVPVDAEDEVAAIEIQILAGASETASTI